jgi:hypothetical protein
MNVSKEADEFFVAELRRTDPRRYANLIRNMGRVELGERWPVGTCQRCAGTIYNAPFVRDGLEYCSRACRDTVAGSGRKPGRPRLGKKEQAESSKRRREYQRELMHSRRKSRKIQTKPSRLAC